MAYPLKVDKDSSNEQKLPSLKIKNMRLKLLEGQILSTETEFLDLIRCMRRESRKELDQVTSLPIQI